MLPLKALAVPPPPAAPLSASRLPRLLLLDDDPFVAGAQSAMLRSMGFVDVTTAASAESALASLAAKEFDIVVCDLGMPGTDGIESLRTLAATAAPPSVILLSGQGGRILHAVLRLLEGGPLHVLGAIEKPAARDELAAMLTSWAVRKKPPPARPLQAISPGELGLAAREGQWVLHYQPQIELATGTPIGVEALVRWEHPRHGLLYPDRFIGLAEKWGVIDTVATWVCDEAIRQLAEWQAAGLQMTMAVNLSMDNLADRDFARRLGERVDASAVSPAQIVLEVTESRLMAPSLEPIETLVRLSMRGFGLSIDDFGTGHSSLAQLRDVPFTELKVDRGFVSGARRNPVIRPILEGSIGIASRMGMRSVAEGVETVDDLHLLRELHCDVAQGYFIARPMPAVDLAHWWSEWQAPEWMLHR